MKKFINSVKTFPLIWGFVAILILFAPSALLSPAESQKYAIVNGVGIDRVEDDIELSVVINVPQPSTSYQDIYNVVSGRGKTLPEALSKVELLIGKELGLLHTLIIVLSQDFLQTDVIKEMSLFFRAEKLGNNSLVIMSEGKASELLSTAIQVQKQNGIRLSEIIRYNNDHCLAPRYTNLEQLYRGYLSPTSSAFLPILNSEKGSEGLNTTGASKSTSSQNSDGGQEGGGSGSSGQGAKQSQGSGGDKLINTGEVALIKKGKFIKKLSIEEVKALNWITKVEDYGSIEINDITDEFGNKMNLSFDIKNKRQITSVYYENGFPILNFDIYLNLVVTSAVAQSEDIKVNLSLLTYQGKSLDMAIEEILMKNINSALQPLRADNIDCLEFHSTLSKRDEKLLEEFINKVGEENFLKFVEVRIIPHIVVKN